MLLLGQSGRECFPASTQRNVVGCGRLLLAETSSLVIYFLIYKLQLVDVGRTHPLKV
jgi:hypothetical protein